MLHGRRVLLAVTGGVAAYKSAYLARRLIESRAEVEVILSESASEFVGPQTFAAITGRQPASGLFGAERVSPHTELARWADAVIVAPATAATLSRLAHGLSEDLVSATLLATSVPVILAPAMHTEMWNHPATQRNIKQLEDDGYYVVGPGTGGLAGGDTGIGRVAEPEELLDALLGLLAPDLTGRRVLVTAGGTREPIDPVRYLGNRSTGRMGHAIADEASRRGHDVTLVTTSDLATAPSVKVIRVETAAEMLEAVSGVDADIAVMAAAVADFRPSRPSESKIARTDALASIDLAATPDVLESVAARSPRPFLVGFAAESGDLDRAVRKAATKGVDFLVYNDVTEPGSGFGTDTNRVAFIDPDGGIEELPLLSKREVAARLWDRISEALGQDG